ncbi:acyclic terpene utilization AtuA family protein [Xenophilus aerolatus]|nr:acyclic terpene utilization AtuA family protein [Xenophilus aerolatus]
MTTDILIPTGALGAGIQEAHVRLGLQAGVHAIACDAGSTDSGPYYLSTGRSKYARAAVKADLRILMRAQAEANIPLLIGSCGTSGADDAVAWTEAIALEIAHEEGLHPRIAILHSELDKPLVLQRAADRRIDPLAPVGPITPASIDACDRIVALMGPEPYIGALRSGADIVLGGRTSDAAVLAAVALMHGQDAGAAWHAGKVGECGGLCTCDPRAGGVILRVGQDGFEIEPLDPDNRCTPESVSAHMLYESTDPFQVLEPGGMLDVRDAVYEALDPRRVRVSGAKFVTGPYTMKLEGAGAGAFQTIMIVGIRDPRVLAELPRFLDQMQAALGTRVAQTLGDAAGEFDLSLRPYGWNAVSGMAAPMAAPPQEIGLMLVVTAATQELATQIAKACNPVFFHMPLNRFEPLPSYGFPFSPAEIERGQVHRFLLNHVVHVDHPGELVRTRHTRL